MDNTDVLEAPETETTETPETEQEEQDDYRSLFEGGERQTDIPEEDRIMFRDFTPEIRHSKDGSRTSVKIMTGDIARDRMIIDPAGLSVENYRNNPVLLWGHGWDKNGSVPIGQGSNLRTDAKGEWIADTVFDEDDFSQLIRDKVKTGSVRAVSIRWRTLERMWKEINGVDVLVITKADLLEISYVAVPADPGAVVLERSQKSLLQNGLEYRLAVIETQLSGLTSKLDAAIERGSETAPAQEQEQPATPVPSDEDAKATRSDPVHLPATPTPRPATAQDYTQLAMALVPTIERAAIDAIDRETGRL